MTNISIELNIEPSLLTKDSECYVRLAAVISNAFREGFKPESAWDDLECSFEQSVVNCIEGAVKSLTSTQRAALERHLELTMVVRVREYEDRLEEARQKVWLALLANGCAG